MTGGVGRHIGKNDIGRSARPVAEQGFQALRCGLVQEIQQQEFDAGDRFHFKYVERDDPPALPDPFRGDLAPTARRRAEIDDVHAGFEQVMLVVDFSKLVGRAGAKAFALGPRHIRVADLALEPSPRRRLATFLSLKPRHDASGFAPNSVGAHHLDQHALTQPAIGNA